MSLGVKMTDPKKKISMNNTKKEILDSYHEMLKKIEILEQQKINPVKKKEDKKEMQILENADQLSIEKLKSNFTLLQKSLDKNVLEIFKEIEDYYINYENLKNANQIQKKQLQEFYEIEKNVNTLIALIETQNEKKNQYEQEMEAKKVHYETLITQLQEKWKLEKQQIEKQKHDLLEQEKIQQKRLKEEFKYQFEREKMEAMDVFQDKKKKLENDLQEKIISTEKDFTTREKILKESEEELSELRKQAADFSATLTKEIEKTKKEISSQKDKEFSFEKQLLVKQNEIELKVLQTKIINLEKTVTDQEVTIQTLSAKLEEAYSKIQHVAEKAIDGASKNIFFPQKISENTK